MTPPSRPWTDRLGRAFALDLRSLAALRAGLGLVLLLQTLMQLATLGDFITDAGIWPRSLQTLEAPAVALSLHLANGSWVYAVVLQVLLAGAAVAMALGWNARSANLLAWVLTVSLIHRNDHVVGSADLLIAALLLWCWFLPTAARWSLDRALSTSAIPADHRHTSWASAALLLQVLTVFAVGAWLKPPPSAGLTSVGLWLQGYPELADALGLFERYAVISAGLLLTWRDGRFVHGMRIVLLLQLLAVTVLTALTQRTGLLPLVQAVSLLALVGPRFWDLREARLRRDSGQGELRVYYDGDCAFCFKCVRVIAVMLALPHAQLLPAQQNRRADSLMRAQQSWVVIDHDDSAHLKGVALLRLMQRSPLLGWARGALRAPLIERWADAAYEAVARQRPLWARRAERWLPERPRRFSPGIGLQRTAGLIATLLLVWNLFDLSTASTPLRPLLGTPLQLLRLDQRWDGYWPASAPSGDYWIAAAHLADGREVDALRRRDALRFDLRLPADDDSLQWQTWRQHMTEPGLDAARARWAERLCQRWNAPLPAESRDRIVDLKLISIPGDAAEQRVLGRYDCPAP